ncbi:hypothetical protein ACA910_010942 [Epithemia clementina (nom. ined.)]
MAVYNNQNNSHQETHDDDNNTENLMDHDDDDEEYSVALPGDEVAFWGSRQHFYAGADGSGEASIPGTIASAEPLVVPLGEATGAFFSEYHVKQSDCAAQFFIAGRGGETNFHIGNRTIRTGILRHLSAYLASPRRGKGFCRDLLQQPPPVGDPEFKSWLFVVRKSYFDKNRALGKISKDRVQSVLTEHSRKTLQILPDCVYITIGRVWTVGIIQDLLRGGAAAHRVEQKQQQKGQPKGEADAVVETAAAMDATSTMATTTETTLDRSNPPPTSGVTVTAAFANAESTGAPAAATIGRLSPTLPEDKQQQHRELYHLAIHAQQYEQSQYRDQYPYHHHHTQLQAQPQEQQQCTSTPMVSRSFNPADAQSMEDLQQQQQEQHKQHEHLKRWRELTGQTADMTSSSTSLKQHQPHNSQQQPQHQRQPQDHHQPLNSTNQGSSRSNNQVQFMASHSSTAVTDNRKNPPPDPSAVAAPVDAAEQLRQLRYGPLPADDPSQTILPSKGTTTSAQGPNNNNNNTAMTHNFASKTNNSPPSFHDPTQSQEPTRYAPMPYQPLLPEQHQHHHQLQLPTNGAATNSASHSSEQTPFGTPHTLYADGAAGPSTTASSPYSFSTMPEQEQQRQSQQYSCPPPGPMLMGSPWSSSFMFPPPQAASAATKSYENYKTTESNPSVITTMKPPSSKPGERILMTSNGSAHGHDQLVYHGFENPPTNPGETSSTSTMGYDESTGQPFPYFLQPLNQNLFHNHQHHTHQQEQEHHFKSNDDDDDDDDDDDEKPAVAQV